MTNPASELLVFSLREEDGAPILHCDATTLHQVDAARDVFRALADGLITTVELGSLRFVHLDRLDEVILRSGSDGFEVKDGRVIWAMTLDGWQNAADLLEGLLEDENPRSGRLADFEGFTVEFSYRTRL